MTGGGFEVSLVVILENLYYLCRLEGHNAPFRSAAYSVSQLKEPLSAMRERLQELKGVGRTTERIILEILEQGTASYHESFF